jgi:crossover junction endodeoxyribonuclease RuvC
MTLVLGIDPSLSCTGWGLLEAEGSRIKHVANGELKTDPKDPLEKRLAELHERSKIIIKSYRPDRISIEEVFVNKNPQSTLKLAQARGAVIAACGSCGLSVNEYAPRLVKKSVVGTGQADKHQVQAMLKVLLPQAEITGPDAADALAIAITDIHHSKT